MDHFAGLDVSVKETSVCIVDDTGKIVREVKVASEPEALLAVAADLLQDYEAKIAALERMVGRQALEIEFLKGALKSAPRPRSASTSVITGPMASPSPKDAG